MTALLALPEYTVDRACGSLREALASALWADRESHRLVQTRAVAASRAGTVVGRAAPFYTVSLKAGPVV
jgi:hypothetical protein